MKRDMTDVTNDLLVIVAIFIIVAITVTTILWRLGA